MTSLQASLFGLFFGTLTGLVAAAFFYYGRTFRLKHGKLSILLGAILFGGSALGSIFLLAAIGDRFGVGRQSKQHYLSLYGFLLALAVIEILMIRADLRWRKALPSRLGRL
jgi:hypothetical protein